MSCVHRVRWSVKRPENCRFHLSVSHYKDRIVAPDEYSGATVVTPSDEEQVLATKDKLVRDDITVYPAPAPDLRPLSVSENGQYSPDGFDGFSQVSVDVHNHGYSDDLDDFSGGNILALISHGSEYINTGYYPKVCDEYFLKLTKNKSVNHYENLFAALFYDLGARIGIQMHAGNLKVINVYVFPNASIGTLTVSSLSADVPTVLSTKCLAPVVPHPFSVATKPLVIFYGYYNNGFDKKSAFNFYGLKCYEFGTLVKKYVPWLDENNVPCVRELISGDLLYNSGTGAFGYIDLEGNVHDA